MNTTFKVIIPARYASTRLPAKPLLPIAGKPMIMHVCERALEAGAEEVIVATDDIRIFDTVINTGVKVIMTRPDHQSGTERVHEVVQHHHHWQENDIIVNLQGDEPLIPAKYIRDVALTLAAQQQAGIATLAANIHDADEVFNPNAVKVVLDKDGYALYFSRAPIPWERANFTLQGGTANSPHLRHIGLYAYTVNFLKRYCAWQASPLESIEALEQLRILWHGEKIIVKTVEQTPIAGIDTAEDLARVERLFQTAHIA